MGIGFIVLLPFLFWVFIVMLIIAVSSSGKARRSVQTRQSSNSATRRYLAGGQTKRVGGRAGTSVRMNAERPKMREGLFDMKLDKKSSKSGKGFSLGGSFRKSGFDKYEAKGRMKDFVSGYNKTTNVKRAAGMQFSHTYDGHEPWDKCLPKEKDPWDKDFYA